MFEPVIAILSGGGGKTSHLLECSGYRLMKLNSSSQLEREKVKKGEAELSKEMGFIPFD